MYVLEIYTRTQIASGANPIPSSGECNDVAVIPFALGVSLKFIDHRDVVHYKLTALPLFDRAR